MSDQEGKERDNLAAARQQAVDYARDPAAEVVRPGEVHRKHRIVIGIAGIFRILWQSRHH